MLLHAIECLAPRHHEQRAYALQRSAHGRTIPILGLDHLRTGQVRRSPRIAHDETWRDAMLGQPGCNPASHCTGAARHGIFDLASHALCPFQTFRSPIPLRDC
jgi:hypothetical protein